jgi:hypothetical protein
MPGGTAGPFFGAVECVVDVDEVGTDDDEVGV